MADWRIRDVLRWTAEDFAKRGIESGRLDAELLIAAALGVDRVRLYMDLERPLTEEERERIRGLVKRRRDREPVAYILGRRGFYGRDLEVGPAVLVPRPDTEALVERALARLPEGARVLDLCTGSGAIGLTLAAERPDVRVDLTDLSPDALAVAERNAARLAVAERVRLFAGDLFAALPERARYDLIAVNPPYVAEQELATLAPEVKRHEPRLALVAAEGGFAVHDRLVAEARAWLAEDGAILVEVGAGQARELARRFDAAGWGFTAIHEDLAGLERVVEAAIQAARATTAAAPPPAEVRVELDEDPASQRAAEPGAPTYVEPETGPAAEVRVELDEDPEAQRAPEPGAPTHVEPESVGEAGAELEES